MSVNNTTPVIGYTTNGVAASYSFPFKILSASDLQVSLSVAGLPAYAVVFDSGVEGGQVNFVSPPPIGQLELKRNVSLDRTTDYQYQGKLPAEVVNDDFDRIVMMVQQIGLAANRSIKTPATDSTDQILTQGAAARARKALVFDADGNITVSVDNYDDQAASATASAAAARASELNAASSAGAAALSAEALQFANQQLASGIITFNNFDLGFVSDTAAATVIDLGTVS